MKYSASHDQEIWDKLSSKKGKNQIFCLTWRENMRYFVFHERKIISNILPPMRYSVLHKRKVSNILPPMTRIYEIFFHKRKISNTLPYIRYSASHEQGIRDVLSWIRCMSLHKTTNLWCYFTSKIQTFKVSR